MRELTQIHHLLHPRVQLVSRCGLLAAAIFGAAFVGCGDDGGPQPEPRFEVNVSFQSTPENGLPATLCGTFSMPTATSTGLPGILLIPGTDPINRNGGTAGVHYFEQPLDTLDSTLDGRLSYSPPIDVFKAIADDLTDAGFAVLRFDNRTWLATNGSTCGANPGSGPFTTYAQDFVTDSAAALTYLRNRPEVNPSGIFVIGQGLGGVIAILHTAANPIVGAILLDAPSRPIDQYTLDFLRRRLAYLRTLPPSSAIDQAIADQTAEIARVENGFALARARRFPVTEQMLGWSKFYWENWITLTDQTLAQFGRIRVPMLLIHATKDYAIPVSEMNGFGTPGQTGRVMLSTFPTASSLNAVSANGFERTVSPQVLGAMRDWLRRF